MQVLVQIWPFNYDDYHIKLMFKTDNNDVRE